MLEIVGCVYCVFFFGCIEDIEVVLVCVVDEVYVVFFGIGVDVGCIVEEGEV